MRAIYVQNVDLDETHQVEGKVAHHLINVLRVEVGSDILGLDGNGIIYYFKIINIKKKSVSFEIIKKELKTKKIDITLAFGKTKRDAFDLVLKQCCELGISEIKVLETQYSQRFKLNQDRVQKILISGIEQSNNPFLPELSECSLSEIDYDQYENIIYFSSVEGEPKNLEIKPGKTLLVLGPEGGLNSDEELIFKNLASSLVLNLDTSIMRTPTAVACGVGYYLGALS